MTAIIVLAVLCVAALLYVNVFGDDEVATRPKSGGPPSDEPTSGNNAE